MCVTNEGGGGGLFRLDLQWWKLMMYEIAITKMGIYIFPVIDHLLLSLGYKLPIAILTRQPKVSKPTYLCVMFSAAFSLDKTLQSTIITLCNNQEKQIQQTDQVLGYSRVCQ